MDHTLIAQRYIELWNSTSQDEREKLLDGGWTKGIRYQDPLMSANGREELSQLVDGIHKRFPGFVFRLAAPANGFGNITRFSWELGPESGDAPIAGSDVVFADEDGKIDQVIGFLDRVPQEAEA